MKGSGAHRAVTDLRAPADREARRHVHARSRAAIGGVVARVNGVVAEGGEGAVDDGLAVVHAGSVAAEGRKGPDTGHGNLNGNKPKGSAAVDNRVKHSSAIGKPSPIDDNVLVDQRAAAGDANGIGVVNSSCGGMGGGGEEAGVAGKRVLSGDSDVGGVLNADGGLGGEDGDIANVNRNAIGEENIAEEPHRLSRGAVVFNVGCGGGDGDAAVGEGRLGTADGHTIRVVDTAGKAALGGKRCDNHVLMRKAGASVNRNIALVQNALRPRGPERE